MSLGGKSWLGGEVGRLPRDTAVFTCSSEDPCIRYWRVLTHHPSTREKYFCHFLNNTALLAIEYLSVFMTKCSLQ